MTGSERPSPEPLLKKRAVPSRTGGERILEMLWKPQMPWIIGFGASQPYSRGEFQETLWERFQGLSGIFPEFLPESPSRTGGVAHVLNRAGKRRWATQRPGSEAPKRPRFAGYPLRGFQPSGSYPWATDTLSLQVSLAVSSRTVARVIIAS